MEQKSSNAAVAVIALAVVVIVAMVCGMVMWVMQRQMSLNERLLDIRLAEAQARRPEAAAQPAHEPKASLLTPSEDGETTPKTSMPSDTPQIATQPKPATRPAAPKASANPAASNPPRSQTSKPEASAKTAGPTSPKRPAPKEREDAKVGPDGQPLDRIVLPVGNDDLDWQF